jgi:hypothetical protein
VPSKTKSIDGANRRISQLLGSTRMVAGLPPPPSVFSA